MVKYAVLIGLAFLFACTSHTDETVDFDQLAPSSKRYKDGFTDAKKDTLKITDERPEKSLFLSVVDTLMNDSRWVKWDTVLFPDRFGPKSQEKWMAIGSNDSLVLLRYEFKDSLRTKNAFFNWIDCFGKHCTSYVIGDNIRIPHRNGLFLVGAKELIIVEGNKPVNEQLIRAVLAKEAAAGKKPKPEKENWLYVVSIPKSGKTTWKRIDRGEEQPIVKTDENS